MKIAVYTIAKNEAQHVRRWAKSCQDADHRLILDTGSTDNTRVIADGYGVDVKLIQFNPWRFDVARNKALELLPDDIDICIALDMDEVLNPMWREQLEYYLGANPHVTRPRYKYVWSWQPDGSEGLVYGGDKIHARHGYKWKHPVHEVITPLGKEYQGWVPGLEIHHHPDPTKSRGQYFDLLKLAVQEEPNDDRNQFYLGREYFYRGDRDNATRHLLMATMLSKWPPEISAAYRMLYKINGNVVNLYRALEVDPCRRENLVELARHYYYQEQWKPCLQFCIAALGVTDKPLDYLCEPDAWGGLPYDLGAIAAYHLGHMETARTYGYLALSYNQNDERLRANIEFYESR